MKRTIKCGLLTEAARTVLRFGFETVGLETIIAIAYPDNSASRRVTEKVGLIYQGMTRRCFNLKMADYALTRGEWAALQVD